MTRTLEEMRKEVEIPARTDMKAVFIAGVKAALLSGYDNSLDLRDLRGAFMALDSLTSGEFTPDAGALVSSAEQADFLNERLGAAMKKIVEMQGELRLLQDQNRDLQGNLEVERRVRKRSEHELRRLDHLCRDIRNLADRYAFGSGGCEIPAQEGTPFPGFSDAAAQQSYAANYRPRPFPAEPSSMEDLLSNPYRRSVEREKDENKEPQED